MRLFIMYVVLCALLLPSVSTGVAPVTSGSGDTTGSSGDAPETSGDAPVAANAEIVADATAELILARLNGEGQLVMDGHRVVHQPLYLQMNAPASVREWMTSRLMRAGIRIAAEPEGYHTLQIEWEPDNILAKESGNRSHRTLQSDVIFTWYDPEQVIQKTWRDSFVREDRVPAEATAELESSWNPAAFHRQVSSRRFDMIRRIAEPALITGVVAVTIYLLYNVRR